MHDTILIVDDEEQVIKALCRSLMDEDYEIHTALSGDEALALLEEYTFKVILCDERMPGMPGSELLSIVSLRYPETVRITLTGYASFEAAMKAVNEGQIYRFFVKPWNDLELVMAIRSAMDKYDLEMQNRQLLALARSQSQKLNAIETKSPGITHIRREDDGSIVLPELSDEEMDRIMKECGVETP